ncbi:MAG: alpha/beta hydrolase [Rhizobiaceae bacterium]|nr:alpha/beta hydrolase [Rhizobiaceae bacterium]MCV0408650.1 alpha/beta hydrolase [Rhizobiaceae bacterium]
MQKVGEPQEAATQRPRPRYRKRTWSLAIVLLIAGAVALLAIVPEYILYRQRLAFSILELGGGDITLTAFDQHTADGLVLRSWYVAPEEDRPTIVYFAGRDGDIVRKPAHLMRLTEQGYGLLLAGYRGYGGNPGSPTERALYRDAGALLAQADDAGLAPNGYIIYGYSMGSSVASDVAVHVEPRAVILEAPISTFGAAVRQQVYGFPLWLVRTEFDNLARVSELDVPLLILAGGADTVTPPSFALALAAARKNKVTLEIIEDATHLSIIRLGGGEIVRDFIADLDEALEPEEAPPLELQHAGFPGAKAIAWLRSMLGWSEPPLAARPTGDPA